MLKGWIRIGGHGMDQPREALHHFGTCLQLAGRADLFWYEVPCRLGTAVAHMATQRYDEAIGLLQTVRQLPPDPHNDRWRLAAGVWLAACHLERGDPHVAMQSVGEAEAALASFGPFMFASLLPALAARAQLRLGHVPARDEMQPWIERARAAELGYAVLAAQETRIEWLHARGCLQQAQQAARTLQDEAADRGLGVAARSAQRWLSATGSPVR